jgi:glycosyltransferase involved in cell wall biosynthesis
MSRFIFISPVSFEDWDHRSPDTVGIGGSETAHIETARRLAAMGHEVISYAPIPDDCPQFKDGVEWLHLDKADYTLSGIWVISRAPAYVHKLKNLGARQTPWLVCQDVDYSNRRGVRKERVDDYAAFDLIFALCPYQLDYLRSKYPELHRRFCLSRNGVRTDLIKEIEAEGIERKPGKIIHTSSPDRGLMVALHIFKRTMEHVREDIEFYTAYGFNNMLKTIDSVRNKVPEIEKHIQSLKNVTWGERQTQRDLYRHYFESSHYLYITDFPETSCISCMEAQCMGAIPVASSFWALGDYVRWGKNINGSVEHSLTLCKAAMALAENIDKTFDTENNNMEEYRQNMMKWARQEFSWDRVAEQYHALATGEPDRSAEFLEEEYQRPPIISQYHPFQLMNATGKIINLGSGPDYARLREKKGAFNVDLLDRDPGGAHINKVDLKADIRRMPEEHHGRYDTAVLGEILEHCYEEDGLRILREANRCLKPGGKIVITCPEDYRSPEKQHENENKDKVYAEGIQYAHRHDPPLTRKELFDWMHKADFMVRHCDPLNYRNVGIDIGWGVIGIAS